MRCLILTGLLCVSLPLAAAPATQPASRPAPALLAHWTFDEAEGLAVADAAGRHKATLDGEGVSRIQGIHGRALRLAGEHRIHLDQPLSFDGMSQLAFSAWVLPTDLSAYREIFRKEDGEQRVLFSFQDHGRTLALGLNVGGYVECDARIDPARLLDGRWHHCAATFDGQTMRVYLDGAEVGSLQRPGRIAARGQATAFIASLDGGEPFQGLLDDLRIYAAALTDAQVAQLHQTGLPAAAAYPRDLVPKPSAPQVSRARPAPPPPLLPQTPPTRDCTEAEAAAMLEDDWLYQAEGKPLAQRAAEEIAWARAMAARLGDAAKAPVARADLSELDALSARLPQATGEEQARALYLAVRAVKRRLMLRHPALDFTQVLFIDQPYPRGHEWDHQAKHRLGHMAAPGGRLLVLDGLHPAGKLRQLAPGAPAALWRPDLSHDARRVLFCMRPGNEKSFHLYEINLDGTGLRQLTRSLYDDLDPIYLPDGHILFSSTRGNTYIRCMPETYSYVLARCDADGKNIYLVSRNSESDWLPSLLPDGRVIYSRWEYTDKAVWRIQSLWTINQDGTGEAAFWGNQSIWPDHLAQPQPVPGTGKVMFAGVGHHQWFHGSIGLIDPAAGGMNYPVGLSRITWERPWAEVGNGPAETPCDPAYHTAGAFSAYQTPWPLADGLFLVSAQRPRPADRRQARPPFDLYLMDTAGNRELVYRGEYNVFHAMPVRPRKFPTQPDRVAWPGTGADRKPTRPGILYNADVYHGVPDLPRGIVKSLRIVQQDAKTYSTWAPREAAGSHGPGVSAVSIDAVKRILGTVPVHADGSVAFEAPAGQALFFQLLDERGRAVHTMRSFSGVMPGEVRGCIGCHEMHSTAPPARRATYEQPARIAPPPWGAAVTVGYERFVQPTLDRHCGRCHQGQGQARAKLDLTLRPGQGPFKEPYLTLVGPLSTPYGVRRPGLNLAAAIMAENPVGRHHDYTTVRPLTRLSPRSRLIDIATSGRHNGVRIEGEELARLIAWVDSNAPYRGEEEIRQIPDVPASRYGDVPIAPRTASAPVIDRFNIPQDDLGGR